MAQKTVLVNAILVLILVFVLVTLCECRPPHPPRPDDEEWIPDPSQCAFPPYPQQYIAYHLQEEEIVIDGKLDDIAWQQVGWSSEFVDISTDVTPRFSTRMKMRYDDHYLYIGAHLVDNQIWAYQTKHDSVVFYDNDFEVFIDPDGDTHYYKEYEMNALNVTWELMLGRSYYDGGPVCPFEMLPDMKNAVYIYPDNSPPNDVTIPYTGWSVEMAFPLKKLVETLVPAGMVSPRAVPPRQNELWRINFSRVEYHVIVVNGSFHKDPKYPAEDNWVWTPQGQIAMHLPDRWGYLQFSKEAVNTTAIHRDPSWHARQALMQIFNAQATYYASDEGSGRYSANLTQLGLSKLTNKTCIDGIPYIEAGYHYWRASVSARNEWNDALTLNIRWDRLTWWNSRESSSYTFPAWASGGLIGIVVGAGLLFIIQYTSRKMSEPSLILREDESRLMQSAVSTDDH